jgi:hypothetical protein
MHGMTLQTPDLLMQCKEDEKYETARKQLSLYFTEAKKRSDETLSGCAGAPCLDDLVGQTFAKFVWWYRMENSASFKLKRS